jgi:hypothetical protein
MNEGTKICRISTGTWDSGLPVDFQRRAKRSGTFKADEGKDVFPRIIKLETMHAISQIQDRHRFYDESEEDFPKEEDEEYEETPRGPTIEVTRGARSESITKSFTAYEIKLREQTENKSQNDLK